MTKPKLNILILEDDKNDMNLLQEMIKNKGDSLNPTYVRSVEDARDAFRRNLFHLVSLDQRIPLRDQIEPYKTGDENLAAVMAAYGTYQPITTGIVLTGYGAISQAIDASKYGFQYLQKSATAYREWGKTIAGICSSYFDDVLIARGASQLPVPLAIGIKKIRDNSDHRIKLLAIRDLFENALRLLSVALFAAAMGEAELKEKTTAILKSLYQTDRGNAAWKDHLKLLVDVLQQGTSGRAMLISDEVKRFFEGGSGGLLDAFEKLHSLRNELAHDKIRKAITYQNIYEANLPGLHCLLEGIFLFALHPILDNITIRKSANDTFYYSGDLLRGDEFVPSRIDIESRERLPQEGPVWCLTQEAGKVHSAVSLSPLLITHTDEESQYTGMFLLHKLKRIECEYRELTTGKSLILPMERMGKLRQMLDKIRT